MLIVSSPTASHLSARRDRATRRHGALSSTGSDFVVICHLVATIFFVSLEMASGESIHAWLGPPPSDFQTC